MDTNTANGMGHALLLEVEPDLADSLSAGERELLARVTLHVRSIKSGDVEVDRLLEQSGAFAAVIVDGMLMHRVAIAEQPSLRLLGPSDIVTQAGAPRSALLTGSRYRASGAVRLAMLDDKVLLVAQRFPRMFAALQIRVGEQHQRLAAQIAICQLPRVEDRVLAMMWLLSETWGRVTRSGTVLPLALTHDVLGELIGARRSTVTLALKELAEQGALLRHDGEWLLLKAPPGGTEPHSLAADPEVVDRRSTVWRAEARHAVAGVSFEQLSELVKALRETHLRNADEVRSRLDQSRRVRADNSELRDRIATEQNRRKPAP